jgi:hypothetical protein
MKPFVLAALLVASSFETAEPVRVELDAAGRAAWVAPAVSTDSDGAKRALVLVLPATGEGADPEVARDLLAFLRERCDATDSPLEPHDLALFARDLDSDPGSLAEEVDALLRARSVCGSRVLLLAVAERRDAANAAVAARPDLFHGEPIVVADLAGAAALAAADCQATFAAMIERLAADDRARSGVAKRLDAFHAAAKAADLDAYLGCFAPEGVFLGTDATERWDTAQFRAFCAPYFAAGRGWDYVPRERHVVIHPGGDFATFDERLENVNYGELRGSGAARRAGDDWRIVQYDLTFTIPNDRAKEVVALLRAAK